jgi:hypothetical protein
MEDNDQEIIVDEALRNKALDFAEEYFDDMRFENGCIVEKYFMCGDSGEKEFCVSGEILWILDPSNYQFVVGTLDCQGEVNHKTRIVTIAPEYANDDTILLHELIHVFESFYWGDGKEEYDLHDKSDGRKFKETAKEVPRYMRDALLMSLYWDLKERIPDLDKLILKFGHFCSQEVLTERGGDHDILFYLKSLDLDLRLGYELGTVCDYDEYDKEDESKADECKGINE